MKSFAVAALAGLAIATPCPYGQLAESGALSKEETANFLAARAEGETAVEAQMKAVKRSEAQAAEYARQAKFYKRQVEAGALPLGGGLLDGQLQPLTGELALIEIPTVQTTGLMEIPGDDPDHFYVAPISTDVRGMCPTLNTMANHGYISRTGITTFAEAANACQITLGFGYDTCVFLSGLGLLAGGDLPSGIYSIGGEDSRVPNTLGPSLGISKHGFFEVDNSISRQDTYFGNQANFQLDRWDSLVAITEQYGGQFGNEAFATERVERYKEAVATNPEFTAGVRWLAVTTAERVFIFRALPNGTDETDANYANVAPFYLNETFPDEWYRRDDAYSLAATGTDIATLLATSSEVTTLGQNEGLDNFVPLGVDISDFTPADATCFLFSSIADNLPGVIAPEAVDSLSLFQAFVDGMIAPFFSAYNCSVLSEYSESGADAGTAGVSTTCNVLVDGDYEC